MSEKQESFANVGRREIKRLLTIAAVATKMQSDTAKKILERILSIIRKEGENIDG